MAVISYSETDCSCFPNARCDSLTPLHTRSPTDLATIFQNVVGVTPTDAQVNHYASLLQGDGGDMTQADILVLAVNENLNAINIDLIGLSNTGVGFV